jgi:AGCS family alanine or glycine:cation symporter
MRTDSASLGDQFNAWVSTINGVVWGPYMVALLVGVGLYLTLRLGFVQFRYLGHSVRCILGRYDDPDEAGDINHFRALAAALSATIGTGNIAGVATAIALGGPGAVFWMWVTALVGMATKFASCSLAVRYRRINPDGSASGGPMYYLAQGLGLPWLGAVFALFAGFASFGIGCAVQSNSVVDGLLRILPASVAEPSLPGAAGPLADVPVVKVLIGVTMAVLVGAVILGGIKRIASVAARIVPLMCVLYIGGALVILVQHVTGIPQALGQIVYYAFTPIAAGGGFLGVVVQRTVEKGVARGVFSNESGLGSAPMVHAAAKTHEMIREGFVAMLGPFIDTIIVCTMTALVIVLTGTWEVHGEDGALLYGPGGQGVPVMADGVRVVGSATGDGQLFLRADGTPYEVPTGASLTTEAFGAGLGQTGEFIVALGLVLFAFSTMISWSYYGDRCFEYLLGSRAIMPYRLVFCVFVVIGAIGGLEQVWLIADTLNALMAIPNLIALVGLAGLVSTESRDYLSRLKQGAFDA